MHLMTRFRDADTSASLITSTTATRAFIVAASTESIPPSGAAPDSQSVVHDLGDASLARLGRRHRVSLVHAHDPAAMPAATRVAGQLRVPLVATFEERDGAVAHDVAELLSGGALVLVPSVDCQKELVRAGVPLERIRILRIDRERGARAAELDAHYLAISAGIALPQTPLERSSMPTVTVVVPTFNRKDMVLRTVDAIQAQTYPAELTQVVVVDDFSTDGAADALAERYGDAIKVVQPAEKRHAAGARNRGIEEAQGEIVAFTDDDCRPEPGWLAALVAGFDADVDLVQGRTVPDPAQRARGRTRAISTPREFGLYETANLAYRRSALQAVGTPPFDPQVPDELRRVLGRRLGTPGVGEDTDLAWRVKRLGGRSRFAAYAVVHHEVTSVSRGAMLRDALRAAGFPLLVRRVPELRDAFLWRRYFVRPRHAALAFGLLSVAGVVWSPYFALGVTPYFWLLLQPARAGRRGRLRAAPFRAVLDLAELLGCLLGSVHARRLVL